MLYSCPNHELSREMIIQNFYARLSHNDQTMLDTSCKKSIEFRWDLLERIKCNSEDWELNVGKESGIKLEYESIKDLTQSYSIFIPDSLPSSNSQSSELNLILSKRSHLNSIVFFIKESVQEVSSMD